MIEAERVALRRRYAQERDERLRPDGNDQYLELKGGNVIANVPHNLTDSAESVAAILSHMAGHGYDVVEVTKEAEDTWMELLRPNPVMTSFLADCTPGYYNSEGHFYSQQFPLGGGYRAGAPAYFRYIRQWRDSGAFAGLRFSRG